MELLQKYDPRQTVVQPQSGQPASKGPSGKCHVYKIRYIREYSTMSAMYAPVGTHHLNVRSSVPLFTIMGLGAGLRQRHSPAMKPSGAGVSNTVRSPFVKSASVASQPNTDSPNPSPPSLQHQNSQSSVPTDSSEEGMFIPPGK